jgi:hypothetical protein
MLGTTAKPKTLRGALLALTSEPYFLRSSCSGFAYFAYLAVSLLNTGQKNIFSRVLLLHINNLQHGIGRLCPPRCTDPAGAHKSLERLITPDQT